MFNSRPRLLYDIALCCYDIALKTIVFFVCVRACVRVCVCVCNIFSLYIVIMYEMR